MTTPKHNDWWARDDLGYGAGGLALAGCRLDELARKARKPIFAYSAPRLFDNLSRVAGAMASRPMDFRMFYAMKANRYPPLLKFLRRLNLCGVDVCSPGELRWARKMGFKELEISYTGTSVSDADLEVLGSHPRVWFNADSLSAIRRIGERCPGREIGIRVNPGVGLGYRQNHLLEYAGKHPTKFGIYRSRFLEALALARKYRLRVVGVHFHCGCGYLNPQLPALEAVLESCRWFLRRVPDLRYVNIGGGLGIPLAAEDEPLDLEIWSGIVAWHLAEYGAQIWVEPGDYIVKDSGVLVLQVNTVEKKQGVVFVGVNGGFNLHVEPAFYHLPLQVVPCREPETARRTKVTIAGNINEALDVLAANVDLPPVREGDYLAFLNAGGYGSAMSSNHCLRGDFEECLVGSRQGKVDRG